MAITLTGTGGLYTRWGKIIKSLGMPRGAAGVTAPSPASAWGAASGPTIIASDVMYDAVDAQYASNEMDLVSGLYADQAAYRSSLSGRFSYFQTLAQQTLIRMADRSSPLPTLDIRTAMTVLIKQMEGAGDSVEKQVVGVTAAAVAGNIGNPKFIASVVGPDGLDREYVIPEIITVTANNDVNHGATAGRETFTIASPVAISDPMDRNWPGGSAASGTLTMCDNTLDAQGTAGANILSNSDFEVWTVANIPDYFVRVTGTLGTTIKKDLTIKHRGTASLSFVGNSSELTAVDTTFGVTDTTGTAIDLSPQTVYPFSIWVYTDVQPAAGVFAVSLVDGSDAVIADDAGTNNITSTTLSTMAATTWVNVTGFIRTPTAIPAVMKLRLALTTAITTGSILYFDDLGMCLGTPVYTGGPQVAMFHGLTDVLIGDSFTATVTNAGLATFQLWMDRIFGMRSLGMQLPSATSPTISDALAF